MVQLRAGLGSMVAAARWEGEDHATWNGEGSGETHSVGMGCVLCSVEICRIWIVDCCIPVMKLVGESVTTELSEL